ncbi:MAG: TauD/TfdA family dioxygenase [Rhizobiales bacterium]|nr:TauD/TfdA family dioxygenase [Hyphomicrobiales bacterium]
MDVRHQGNRLHLKEADGFAHIYSALWLREATNHPEFRDPKTGHKIADGDLIPLDIRINAASVKSGVLDVTFSDGHATTYLLGDLRAAAEKPLSDDLEGAKQLCDASLDPMPWHNLDDLKSHPQALLSALDDVGRLGFALVRGVPTRLNGVQEFIDLIGSMRVTNNGAIQDVKAVPPERAYDLSMTPRALEPHTDNPYRIPQPGYVLLHCLTNDAEGGESGLTDGFYVAERMRREHPALFESLCTVPIVWRYADEQAILEDTSPFVDLALDGSIKHVRYHGRSDRVSAVDADTLDKFYKARRIFSGLINADDVQVRFKLNPGEMYMVDNYRMIHSRKAFKLTTGSRHMRQAYFDRDVVQSRQKTLRRDINAKPWKHRD